MPTKSPQVKTLNDGNMLPMLGYGTGTALLKHGDVDAIDRTVVTCVANALSLGITHLDNAEMYRTEPEMGEAIDKSGLSRDRLYVTTKVLDNVRDVSAAIDASLSRLKLDYVDLYLIHSPFFTEDKELLQKAWRDMEAVQQSGKAKSIGVSNFQIRHIEAILEVAKVIPAVNQIEFHPYLQRDTLRMFSESKGIVTAAFSPLVPLRKGSPGPLDPLLSQLAQSYGVAVEVILLRWSMQKGVVTITTSQQKRRIQSYLDVLAFELSDNEVAEITSIGRQKHFRNNHFMHRYSDTDRE